MKNYDRDLLLLCKSESYSEDLLQREVESLHSILRDVEEKTVFCTAHEIVTRNSITSKPKAILKATAKSVLKPFYFLINKN